MRLGEIGRIDVLRSGTADQAERRKSGECGKRGRRERRDELASRGKQRGKP
jgi:hypothetical protein